MSVYSIVFIGLVYSLITRSSTSSPPVKFEDYDTTVLPTRNDCGNIKETKRIYGGKAAELGEFPWMVSIEYKSEGTGQISEALCIGSLINKRYVLTSGNCLRSKQKIPVNAILGDWKVTTDPDCVGEDCANPVQKLKIRKAILHEHYSPRDFKNDIGLIHLDTDATISEFVSPICLPPRNLPNPKDGTYVTVAGWGRTETENLSDVLLKVNLPIVNTNTCSEQLKRNITESSFCAGGEKGKDSCYGDSGGPAMLEYGDDINQDRWYQRGIAAAGSGCGRPGFPGIYTRVDSYVEWIVKTIKKNEAL